MPEHASPPSLAEQRASGASELPAFGGLNLYSVRRDLIELLEAIRTSGFFEEYTKHDISHIEAMLEQVQWVIPPETQSIMTTADWLLIVLSAYFHDLGMLITKDEYNRRQGSTKYTAFREQALNSQDIAGQEFAARVGILRDDELERFLYQEYVRQNHASRIRQWIEGNESELGKTGAAAAEVRRLVSPLESVFLYDLAVVCESHHLDDLDDTNKYPVDRPYGSSPQEKANVQYAAIILRTIDLLHITRDRTPSVSFRIISPQDPVSQREWARQRAVRAVRSKVADDSEGNLDASLPRDTIEVHARYDNADDYFGLTSYLEYAEDQLRLSYDWAARSNKRFDTQYFFPWRRIDSSNIEAIGFLNRPFEFTLDQDKILELLTGHTLYNDSSVVLRELVQNSLDAVRLAHGARTDSEGLIRINWDTTKRVLEILDNGTGMTQDVIERNFLRVGSSYYQEPRFQKEHPDFFPISRFGIGVLSTFMIADQVEVITCHPDEPKARRLELRTVHGKYLISLLDKTNQAVRQLLPRGTVVRLALRPSARIHNVIQLAQHWIIIPGCKVEVSVDRLDSVQIGYRSVKEALEATLASIGIETSEPHGTHPLIRVIEGVSEGVSLAFAVRWSNYFKEWQFFSYFPREQDRPDMAPAVGTCAEGIRVQSNSPGFEPTDPSGGVRDIRPPLAIANIVGRNAPRTNVARSDFELTENYRATLSRIYEIYCSHITTEMAEIEDQRGQSLTWASSEAEYLAHPVSDTSSAVYQEGLLGALRQVPMLLVEDKGKRSRESAEDLARRNEFWTLHGAFPEHIEYLLREIPAAVSFTQLLKNLGNQSLDLPSAPILCSRLGAKIVDLVILESWSIAELRGNEERRRCDARWVKDGTDVEWSPGLYTRRSLSWLRSVESVIESPRYGYFRREDIRIPLSGVIASGFRPDDSAVVIGPLTCLLPGTAWPSIIKEPTKDDSASVDRRTRYLGLEALAFMLTLNYLPIDTLERNVVPAISTTEVSELLDLGRFVELRRALGWSVFDTRRWQREGAPGYR